MNCDHVFDILTRGPFPSGQSSDEAVQRHLSACHQCFELAEALRPAVDLFHESIGADEHALLPSFHGPTAPARGSDLATAVQTAIEHQPRVARGRNPSAPLHAPPRAGWLAAAALVVIAALGLSSFVGSPSTTPLGESVKANLAGTPDRNHQPDARGKQFLASFKLPADCLGVSHDAVDAGSSASHLCCTTCHSASAAKRPAIEAVAVLVQTCKACHIQ